jgi:glycerophosphoryl diester phosphodiesterase
MHFSDWTGGLTTLVHKFGLMAFGWDAQYDYVITDGLRMGLDAVYSDHVDTMVDAYSREIGHVPRC